MDLLAIFEDRKRRDATYSELVAGCRTKALLPGISRDMFEAALKLGFDAAWESQREHHASAAIETATD